MWSILQTGLPCGQERVKAVSRVCLRGQQWGWHASGFGSGAGSGAGSGGTVAWSREGGVRWALVSDLRCPVGFGQAGEQHGMCPAEEGSCGVEVRSGRYSRERQ